MLHEADNPAIEYAEAFARACFDKRSDLRDYKKIFDAVLDRTRRADAPDLRDVFSEWDERTVRRRVEALSNILQKVAEDEKLLYSLRIKLGEAGNQTADQRRKRQTFVLEANVEHEEFYLRKWWSSVFPNKPGAGRLPVQILYPVSEADGRSLVSIGDTQLVRRLSRSLEKAGVEVDDGESGFHQHDPNEAGENLILTGNEETNHVIADVEFPKELTLRCRKDGIGSAQGGAPRWADGEPGSPRTVYSLVSAFPCRWSEAKLWMFEARHDRALEAVGRYFANPKKLESLSDELRLEAKESFPSALQLVFAIDVNRQNQLRGPDGGVRLVDHVSNRPPRLPMNREGLRPVPSNKKLFA